MAISSNRLAIAPRLFSEELIFETSFDEAIDDGPRTDQAKGFSLMKAIKATISSQPELLERLIDVLKRLEPFKQISDKLTENLHS